MTLDNRRYALNYLRGSFSAVAAVFSAWLVQGIMFIAHISSKATGLTAVAGGALGSLFSPLFWILAISFFALFFGASRLSNKPTRIFLFWVPVSLIWTVGVAFIALFTYLWLRGPRA